MRDIIFDEDEVWDGRRIQYTVEDIKELDNAIEIVEMPQSEEMLDIRLAEDQGIDSTASITRQTDHEAETLEYDHEDNVAEKQAEDEELEGAQQQYLSPDLSISNIF